ncbi:MAG TPA: alpha/beta hydrolase [Pseudonocardia sp.]|nr:alpha/beta hydrolase [Pseudonocardia sp.]
MAEPEHAPVRTYLRTGAGQVHAQLTGPAGGRPVVLLHQTPRSVDEYAELAPLLAAAGLRTVALDTPGFGASDPPPAHTIGDYAAGVLGALDTLGLDRFAVLGHHTGGVIAVEVAALAPRRVSALVLSSTPYVDAATREHRRGRASIDAVEVAGDGGHLTALWNARAPHYPPGRPDLLERFVRDALAAGPVAREAGHAAVGAFRMEERVPLVRCPVLCLGADADPFAFPHLEPLARALGAGTALIRGGTVAVMEQCADEVADVVTGWLARVAEEDAP